MRCLIRIGSSVTAIAVGLALLALPAAADGHARIADAGWWWRAQSGLQGVMVPSPGHVEEGELLVQGAPDGPSAVAAVAVELPADVDAATLTLAVADGGDQGGATAVLLACRAEGGWVGTEAGRWATKPPADCSMPVEGVRSEDGETWDFAVSSLQDGRRLSVVILPGVVEDAPPGLDGSSFSLVFEAPTPESVDTRSSATGSGTDAAAPFEAPPPPPPPPPSSDFAPGPPDAFVAPPGDVGAIPEAPPVMPAEPATGTSAVDQDVALPSPFLPTDPDDRVAARAAGALLTAVGVLGAIAIWWRQQANARGAVAAADGGLGRFRRSREGDPAPLT